LRILLAQLPAADATVDALALPVAGQERPAGAAGVLDEALGGLVAEVVGSGEHRGRFGETLMLPTSGRIAARRVLLYGLGPPGDLDGQRLRHANHEMVQAARRYGYRRLAVLCSDPLRPEHLGAVVEGSVMGTWERRSRGSEPPRAGLEELHLLGFGEGREREVTEAQQLGDATNRARDWQNQPANELTPEALADLAREVAARHDLEIEVLGPSELRAGGYHLLLGVAAGSVREPRLIRLEHRGAPRVEPGDPAPKLALVGKGITFDSGGLSIKGDRQMLRMKGDMAGAAAVLAAIEVIAARELPADVTAVLAATENMTGGGAQKPGDVLTSASGKTVEVVNTDAEGRLVLADALTLALRRGATHLVDLATLTGSATVALGHAATLAVSNDDGLWDLTERAAGAAGERVCRLPLYPEYRVLLDSRIADLRNAYYGEAGAICAGMFIEQFAEGRPWAHLDIAASSWNDNSELISVPRGPLGAGSRLSVRLAELFAQHLASSQATGTLV
jgi:leucyl aminopeptidase